MKEKITKKVYSINNTDPHFQNPYNISFVHDQGAITNDSMFVPLRKTNKSSNVLEN